MQQNRKNAKGDEYVCKALYKLSEHRLAIEKGHGRLTWLSREDRLCAHSPQNEVETELRFLTIFPVTWSGAGQPKIRLDEETGIR